MNKNESIEMMMKKKYDNPYYPNNFLFVKEVRMLKDMIKKLKKSLILNQKNYI